jgi:hypothetical protein
MAEEQKKPEDRQDWDFRIVVVGTIVMVFLGTLCAFVLLLQKSGSAVAFITSLIPIFVLSANQVLQQISAHKGRRQITQEVVKTRHDLRSDVQAVQYGKDLDKQVTLQAVAAEVRTAERDQILSDPKFRQELVDMFRGVASESYKDVCAVAVKEALKEYHEKFHADKGLFQ